MNKRLVAGPLWFLATWCAYEIAALVLGAPRTLGPVLALVVASLVVLDPAGLIWPTQDRAVASRPTTPGRDPGPRSPRARRPGF